MMMVLFVKEGVIVSFKKRLMDVHAATYATVQGEDYAVVRVYGAWQVTPRVTIKARIENLLDEQYEQVHGYPQLGLGAFAGVEVKF